MLSVLLDLLRLGLGLALLAYAADRFVIGAARLAVALRISAVVIGALVIGFGTSAPELLVTSLATVQGRQALAFGNIVGSNTANVLLVVGAAAAVRALPVASQTMRREMLIMLAAVGLLAVLTADGQVATADAAVLLAAAVAAIGAILLLARRDRAMEAALGAEVAEYAGTGPQRLLPAALLALAGLAGTLAGAQLLVDGAAGLAVALGASEAVIGLTVVAVGTSLPELITALAAARRDEPDLIIGNILGSNIFNSLPVAGVAGLLDTTGLGTVFELSLALMMAACVLFAVLARTGFTVHRWEGALLLAGFVAVTATTI